MKTESHTTSTPNETRRLGKMFWHARGYWCRKIDGRQVSFGADDAEAIRRHDALLKRIQTTPSERQRGREDATVRQVCNEFWTYQTGRHGSGEIGARQLYEYRRMIEAFASGMGGARPITELDPDDWRRHRAAVHGKGMHRKLDRHIALVRAMFEWAFQNGVIEAPPRYGSNFQPVARRVKTKARNDAIAADGVPMFEGAEVRRILDNANPLLKACVLLGINCAMGAGDIAALPKTAVDLEGRVVEFPRPKTGIHRICPLWDETVEAIGAAPKGRGKLLLTTPGGHRPLVYENQHDDAGGISRVVRIDWITTAFHRLIGPLGIKRRGLSFYGLRRSWRTWADELRDPHAAAKVMGHSAGSVAGLYVQRVEHQRLIDLCEHVRQKIWPTQSQLTQPANVAAAS